MAANGLDRRLSVPVLTLALLLVAAPAWAWPPVMLDAGEGSAPQSPREVFPKPDQLEDAINFWRSIFTEHPSDRVVIHDRDNMGIVWRVVELPKDDAGVIEEGKASQHVRAEIDDVRQRLVALELDPTPRDEEDRVLLALAGQDPMRLRGAPARLRSQRGVADHFQAGLLRSRQWVAEMRAILLEEGVPTEIACLPFVESMFNPLARSSVGAAGLWQLMPATARGLGLKVGKQDDERLDIKKATRAAARMLKQNYRMLGSWPLAITAYNHGPNGVRRAVDKVGSTDLMQLIEGYDQATWGFASKNFYAEFLAALAITHELEQRTAVLPSTEAAGVRE